VDASPALAISRLSGTQTQTVDALAKQKRASRKSLFPESAPVDEKQKA
jgi:hypothetical protein